MSSYLALSAKCTIFVVSVSCFIIYLSVSVGKDILIDKFWIVWLVFERLGDVYGFCGGISYFD